MTLSETIRRFPFSSTTGESDPKSAPSRRRMTKEVTTKMARKSAAAKAAERGGEGHNLPPKETYDDFLDRLHVINDRMDEDMGTHRADMLAVYEEMATACDMPKEVAIAIFKADRKEQKAQKKAAKMDTRSRQAYERLAAAYGEDSPLGQYASRMAKAAGANADKAKADDAETDAGNGEKAPAEDKPAE